MPTLVVHAPGALTTVQDLGRPGFGRVGVASSGALDPWSLQLANLLLGNTPGAAALEIAGPGATFGFYGTVSLCVVGADLDARLDEREVRPAEVVTAREGQVLRFATRTRGFRTILALAGGLASPRWLGSVATDLGAGLPRARLRAGDLLEIVSAGPPPPLTDRAARLRDEVLSALAPPGAGCPVTLRIVPQPLAEAAALSATPFTLTDRCNRTGMQLAPDSPDLWPPVRNGSMRSEPVATGTIQLPPDGQPFLLLADHPTVGGYPVLAHLSSVDRAAAAQLAPRDRVRFAPIGAQEARALLRHLTDRLALLKKALPSRSD